MKFTRIIALALVGIMLVFTLGACGSDAAAVTATVTIKDQNDVVLRENIAVSVEEGQDYLEALIDAVDGDEACAYDYPEGGAFNSITVDEVVYAEYAVDEETGSSYYWGIESLNGELVDMSINAAVVNGDTIVFKYMATESTLATITVYDEDRNPIIEEVKVEVGKESISIAQAVALACEDEGVECEVDDDVIVAVDACRAGETDTQNAYWTYTKNGKGAKEGDSVKKDDVVEIKFVVEAK